MATRLKPVDVAIVGVGLTGTILAKELAEAGLKVVGLERGRWRDTDPDFGMPYAHDELRFVKRHELMQDLSRETITFRNNANETALPMRQLGSFRPGEGVGGAAVHWGAVTWRFLPWDFETRSRTLARYGKEQIAPDCTSQDWGVTYDELERHFDRFEYLYGISGKAGNLNGAIQEGGNPFEGSRKREYPNPPMEMTYPPTLFAEAARSLGKKPFPQPSANMSRPYTNPLGVQLGPCTYCGFCEKFGCGNYSKATAQTTILPVLMRKPNFTLRTEAEVIRINLDSSGKRAVSVTYIDAAGEEVEQPAEMILLTAYILHNVRLLLLSKIGRPYDPATGEGVVGKNYAYQITSSVNVFYADKILNPFIGAGAHGMLIDDYNGDNFDHSGLGFIGGGFIGIVQTGARPIESHATPDGTPNWGSKWKRAVAETYLKSTSVVTHGAVMSHRGNCLDLDPTYHDVYGRPLMRMTFDFTDNEHKMSDYLTDRAEELAKAMKPASIKVNPRKGSWDVVPYQTTHNTGGAIMGTDPATSAVNRYLQSWDVPNLFVHGASAFPQNPGYNPTGTVAALAYWSAQEIRSRYLRSPGPLA